MGKHYTKAELDLYRHHQLSVLGRITCGAHLQECPECAKLLEELKADDELIKKLRESVRIYGALPSANGANRSTR